MRPGRWLRKCRQNRADRNALWVAIERFSMLHPHWYGAFFDQHFIERFPGAALECIDGAELAREWARQFRYTDERQRMIDIRQVTPVAESFLRLLDSTRRELRAAQASTRVPVRRILPTAERRGNRARSLGPGRRSSASARIDGRRRNG